MRIPILLLCLTSCLGFAPQVTATDNPQTTEFYFIRHAESEVNREGNKIGGVSSWAEITDEGKEAARTAGRQFKSIPFDACYASDTIRTQQTARYFFEHYSNIYQRITLDPSLREKDQGDWTGRLRSEVYTPEMKALINWNFVPGDTIKGESDAALAQRMVRWVKAKVQEHPNQRVIVFSHGLAIKYLVAELMDIDRKQAPLIPLDNMSLTVVKYRDGEFSVPVLNDSNHLKETVSQKS